MSERYPLRTMRKPMARVVGGMYEADHTIFSVREAADLLGNESKLASNMLGKAIKRGIVNRIRRGVYQLVPFDVNVGPDYIGNPYLVAAHLIGDAPWYLSHATAMGLHKMRVLPEGTVHAKGPGIPRSRVLKDVEFRFVSCQGGEMFGITRVQMTSQRSLPVSDLERTILDGLLDPKHCGGYQAVQIGARRRQRDIHPDRLVDYAIKLDSGAVYRRLGFLMESLSLGAPRHLTALRERITEAYLLLDPTMPPGESNYIARWRLKMNAGDGVRQLENAVPEQQPGPVGQPDRVGQLSLL